MLLITTDIRVNCELLVPIEIPENIMIQQLLLSIRQKT